MDEFRQRAKEARKRMKKGFWEPIIEERRAIISDAEKCGKDMKVVKDMCKRRIVSKMRDFANNITESPEEIMYKKVCQLMENDDVLMNPLSKLIDHSVYDKMDDHAKQTYILKLSEQYIKMKERYMVERGNNLNAAY